MTIVMRIKGHCQFVQSAPLSGTVSHMFPAKNRIPAARGTVVES
jgi:hypothetical protein